MNNLWAIQHLKRWTAVFFLSSSAFTLATASQAAQFFTIDVPGAADTFPMAINAVGTVTGGYCSGSCHGFVRAPDGTISTFDAGQGSTDALAINADGAVTGEYGNFGENVGGFLRNASGKITIFSGEGASQTVGSTINSSNSVAGYVRVLGMDHAFLWKRSGGILSFDGPGADGGTVATSINKDGSITGHYTASNVMHGYVRDAAGTFTSFDPSESGGTTPQSINAYGDIVGDYSLNGIHIGFLRDAGGTISSFRAPKDFGGTFPVSVNNKQAVAGILVVRQKKTLTARGFLRTRKGSIDEFDAPGTIAPGTIVSGLNSSNVIVGYYSGPDRHTHGFIRIP